MSSRVLALKYRPQTFGEVVGQETTVRILKNALEQKRLHHAYLFTGPRGIGKTSLARIFAKALNCEKGPTPDPCGECVSCREITEGRSLSVMEIDGASNTSVDDVRDLRDKISYLPAGGRYKIYLIDEVHMLSTAAFNALLKTLEEPPPHALFLFATTEPQKVPVTVLSRVIRFDLRPITLSQIVDQLKRIAKTESVQAEEEALFLIAREAEGSLRDALSLVDQVISFAGPDVTVAAAEGVVGISTRRFVIDLIRAILQKNPSAVLRISEEAHTAGIDTKRLSLDLLKYLRHLAVAKVCQEPSLFDLPEEDLKELIALVPTVSEGDLDHLFQILQKGVADLLRSPLPKVFCDILLLRLCHYETLRPLEEILKTLTDPKPLLTSATPPKNEMPLFTPSRQAPQAPAATPKGWPDFLAFLRSRKPQLYAMVSQGELLRLDETEAVLIFPSQSIHLSLLREGERASILRECAGEFFGRPVGIRIESAPDTSRIVDEVISIFSAKPL